MLGDLEASKRVLRELGAEAVDFSPPYGAYDRELIRLVKKAGFRYVHVQKERLNYPGQTFVYRVTVSSPDQAERVLDRLFRGAGVRHEMFVPVRVDGELLSVGGFLHWRNRTMVPVRELFERLGAKVEWSQEKRGVVVRFENREVVLRCGTREALVNGARVKVSPAPEVRNGRMYVPVRFVSEALGFRVSWDQEAREVLIEKR